jgi:hypothetical protein
VRNDEHQPKSRARQIVTEVSNEEGHCWTIMIRRENPKHENNPGFLEILGRKDIIYNLYIMSSPTF